MKNLDATEEEIEMSHLENSSVPVVVTLEPASTIGEEETSTQL